MNGGPLRFGSPFEAMYDYQLDGERVLTHPSNLSSFHCTIAKLTLMDTIQLNRL